MENQQPQYQIGNLDLSEKWLDLVAHDKVSVTVEIPTSNSESDNKNGNGPVTTTSVKYGVRRIESKTGFSCQEYVMEVGLKPSETSTNPRIRSINATLANIHNQQSGRTANFKKAGSFVAQLQVVRTLRPPPSDGFSEASTAVPPDYNAESDSFVTGPLRLELRPLVGRLQQVSSTSGKHDLLTPWDIFHNVSPADARGHFLLLPTLSNKDRNWRGQIFTTDDCHDVVHLANAIDPPGSLFIGYNSVGAGASQNHIHCHAWPCPPIPLIDSGVNPWNAYPVSNVTSICDFLDISAEDGQIEVSLLDYPVFCVLLSAPSTQLTLLSAALDVVMSCLGTSPHNLAFLNRMSHQQGIDADESKVLGNGECNRFVDVYVFARSKERSNVLPSLKLGVSEMMGVFHAQSDEELQKLASLSGLQDEETNQMEQALLDVTVDNEDTLWQSIKEQLEALQGRI
ncbi:MAG: hypothetical protein SGILL_008348 [Bacillariaceae sp.]